MKHIVPFGLWHTYAYMIYLSFPIKCIPFLFSDEKVSCENEDIEDLKICQNDNCTKDCSINCDKKKNNIYFGLRSSKWMKVYYVKDLLEILRTSGNATYMLVAGNTARGILTMG